MALYNYDFFFNGITITEFLPSFIQYQRPSLCSRPTAATRCDPLLVKSSELTTPATGIERMGSRPLCLPVFIFHSLINPSMEPADTKYYKFQLSWEVNLEKKK